METVGTEAQYRPSIAGGAVVGGRCEKCAYATAPSTARCPACGAPMHESGFSTIGTVWGSTIVHIAVAQHEPPIGFAYIDLDDGPRVLACFSARGPLSVGARVEIAQEGDDLVAVELVESS